MKNLIAVLILAVICVVLALGLVAQSSKHIKTPNGLDIDTFNEIFITRIGGRYDNGFYQVLNKNHEYLLYSSYSCGVSLVHSESCPCKGLNNSELKAYWSNTIYKSK